MQQVSCVRARNHLNNTWLSNTILFNAACERTDRWIPSLVFIASRNNKNKNKKKEEKETLRKKKKTRTKKTRTKKTETNTTS